MDDPSWPLQQAVYAALTTALAGLSPTVGVYDRVPAGVDGKAAFPYVHIGDDQIVSEKDQCHDAMSAYATIHAWSRSPSRAEIKAIMAAVCAALDVKLDVSGFGVIASEIDDGPRHMDGGDGLTLHSVVTFRYRMASVS